MRKYIGLLIVIFYSGLVYSQNLVLNHSFEDYEECPDEVTIDSKKELVPNWYMPNRGTTDYFNSCAFHQVNVPDNVMGHMFALDGNAYTGIILIEQPPAYSKNKRPMNYREYLQTELKTPLKKDSLYCIQFYFSIASYSTYAFNKLGLCISDEPIANRLSSKVLEAEPQIILDTNKVFNDRDNWCHVCDTFRALGDEEYITIGNFSDDYHTEVEEFDNSMYRGTIQQTIEENKIAYYYIDFVSVTHVSDTLNNYCENKFLVKAKEEPE